MALRTIAPCLVATLVLLGALGVVAPGAPSVALGAPGTHAGELVGAAPASGTVEIAPGYVASPGVTETGALAGDQPLDVVVGLAGQDPSGLAATAASIATPGAPLDRHDLSIGPLARDFGAAPSAIADASAYFSSWGLSVRPSPDGLLLDVAGPASAVAAAFHTSFETFRLPDGRPFVSHLSAARLPAGVPWTGALGLGNVSAIAPLAAGTGPLLPTSPASSGCGATGALIPCQVETAYDELGLLGAGTNGTGTTIAIVDAYDGVEPQPQLASDLAAFDTEFGLPSPSVRFLYPVPTHGNLNGTDTGWGLEEALDLEWVHASAPGATIDMTFSPNSGVGLYEAIDYLVTHPVVNVISLSWGEPDVGTFNAYAGPCAQACNASTDGSYAILGPVLEFAAAEGITVLAASGDCGASDGTSGLSTSFPASDPFVTGVGGTQLSVEPNGTWLGEVGWSGNAPGASAPGCQNQGGSGGGYAPFPRPAWQNGTGVNASSPGRGVPDVAAIAAPGVEIVEDGHATGVAGTSVATPIWAGIAAIADQYAGASLGFLDPSLYGILGSADYPSDFHEIVSGSNPYPAGPGWNAVTGIGSPIVGALVPELAAGPRTLSNLSVVLGASVTYGRAPLTVTFAVDPRGGTGAYPIEAVSFGDGTAGAASGGIASHTYTDAGVFPATGYAIDSSGNLSDSMPITLVVGGGRALTVDLSVSSSAPAAGAGVTFTTRVSGGVAPYAFALSFGDGTFVNGSSASTAVHAYPVAGGFCAVAIVSDASSPPDGGESAPMAIAVGGAPAPSCPSGLGPLTVTPNLSPAPRDAPADFPDLFDVQGGTGTVTEQWVSSDPYVAACGCAIFRSAGRFPVWLYANDSIGEHVVGETNVTVEPPIAVSFQAGPTDGPAPLSVDFWANASAGGPGPPIEARWELGDGTNETAPSITATFSSPGLDWVVGSFGDSAYGNVSEAFLIDVGAADGSGPYLRATIDPAIDLESGTTVAFSAAIVDGRGADLPAAIAWDTSGGSSDRAEALRTFFAAPAAPTLYGALEAQALDNDTNFSVPFAFAPLFAVEAGGFVPSADALLLEARGAPAAGTAPTTFNGSASAWGPGPVALDWAFGDGGQAAGASASHAFAAPGSYTVTLNATDAWSDSAVDSFSVNVSEATSLGIVGGPSTTGGPAPLSVAFSASASGGQPPYGLTWAFGDGAGAPTGNASHVFDAPGTFRAVVTARDARGLSVNRSFSIVVTSAAPPGGGGGRSLAGIPLAAFVLGTGIAAGAILSAAALARRPRPAPTR